MSDKPETRTEFWHRRGRQLNAMRKGQLVALYRSLGGLGGIHPPEKWSKDDLVASVVDIEWGRLPDEAKKPEPVHMTAPCDVCDKGEGATAHTYKGSHNYRTTYRGPDQPRVPYYEYCAAPGCALPYEHHEAWDLGHTYTAPAEEQPEPPAEATATQPHFTYHYVERPSGAPYRVLQKVTEPTRTVDGPGCTPTVVPLRESHGHETLDAEDTAEREGPMDQ